MLSGHDGHRTGMRRETTNGRQLAGGSGCSRSLSRFGHRLTSLPPLS
jgi:hypothetical protein